MKVKTLNASSAGFNEALDDLLAWDAEDDASIFQRVGDIIASVRKRGDEALLAYTAEFDHWAVTADNIVIHHEQLKDAWEALPEEQRTALSTAAQRIREYAEHQKMSSWGFTDEFGNQLGQKVTALDRVGVYVPGGKAAYPSSVLMNVIPAKVAGVKEIIMVSPTPDGELNDIVLAAAYLAGADKVLRIGGAQAVAALAYGTASVPAVDKIVGPGNIYVATAKKMVFGQVGIDMVAGPSEILIICDGKTNPDWIAMDLFSQAEHDENAQSILISLDLGFIDAVKSSIDKLLPTLSRSSVIKASLEARGAFIYAETMGRYTAEALGDYCAGPNHVLPTSATARFSSPLGVYDFQKRSSMINCTAEGASALSLTASVLARGESLDAHARSAEFRQLK